MEDPQTLASHAERWLPIGFKFSPTAVAVRWMQFGSKRISEPFFHQTIKKLRQGDPPARQRVTGLSTVIESAQALAQLRPAGLIFHVSRCGSTLLANALRTGHEVVVLSEARPVGTFFRPNIFRGSPFPAEGWEEARRMVLDCISTLYAHSSGGREPKLVIKCHAASVLHIALARSVWPETPSVVVIRDPVDVLMSNIAKPAAWAKLRERPRMASALFGWQIPEIQRMGVEEFCARGLARFCESATKVIDAKCRVIDYDHLDTEHMFRIADFFGVKLPSANSARFRTVIGTYAKDPRRVRPFESDRERKRAAASELVRDAVQRWARTSYDQLRALQLW